MRVHTTSLKGGINKSREFARKGLAEFAVNVGTKCGHDCTYCSTGATLRFHSSFKKVGESPFGTGYAIVDADTPVRVAADAAKHPRARGLVQLCTTVDAWAPEAQAHRIGRRCLEAILGQPGWTVRVLTKNAAVVEDFDVISHHRDRILVGLSLTTTPDKSELMHVVEPNASTNVERMAAMARAHQMGLRTYAMFCPLLPGIAGSPGDVEELVGFALDVGAEEIFVEPVNGRGPGLKATEEALSAAGHDQEASAVHAIRTEENWSAYAAQLPETVQRVLRRRNALPKLRFLLYPKSLKEVDLLAIRQDDAGVRWLGEARGERWPAQYTAAQRRQSRCHRATLHSVLGAFLFNRLMPALTRSLSWPHGAPARTPACCPALYGSGAATGDPSRGILATAIYFAEQDRAERGHGSRWSRLASWVNRDSTRSFLTAIASACLLPTNTTSFRPRVIPV